MRAYACQCRREERVCCHQTRTVRVSSGKSSRVAAMRCGGALRPRMGINRVLAMFCGVRGDGDGDDGWLGCVEDGKSGFEMTLTL